MLRDYLLLRLGGVTLAQVEGWERDMVARRRVDASRDLLAFWRPRAAEGPYRPGQLVALPVVGLRRFPADLTPGQVTDGLLEAARLALEGLGVRAVRSPGASALTVEGRTVAAVTGKAEDGVAHARLVLELAGPPGEGRATVADLLGREVDPGAAANAIAWHWEQQLGYAQAAIHPVAYEESLRPRS